jgi:hypothetical protein
VGAAGCQLAVLVRTARSRSPTLGDGHTRRLRPA